MQIQFNKDLFIDLFKYYKGKRSQNELAEEFNSNRSTISLLENGKQLPSLEFLTIFAEKVNKDLDSFFIKEDDDPVMLLMGKMKQTDLVNLSNVIERIKIREHYIAINKRCGK